MTDIYVVPNDGLASELVSQGVAQLGPRVKSVPDIVELQTELENLKEPPRLLVLDLGWLPGYQTIMGGLPCQPPIVFISGALERTQTLQTPNVVGFVHPEEAMRDSTGSSLLQHNGRTVLGDILQEILDETDRNPQFQLTPETYGELAAKVKEKPAAVTPGTKPRGQRPA